jgi:hypothetical protein
MDRVAERKGDEFSISPDVLPKILWHFADKRGILVILGIARPAYFVCGAQIVENTENYIDFLWHVLRR